MSEREINFWEWVIVILLGFLALGLPMLMIIIEAWQIWA